jgi:hypothetical protein
MNENESLWRKHEYIIIISFSCLTYIHWAYSSQGEGTFLSFLKYYFVVEFFLLNSFKFLNSRIFVKNRHLHFLKVSIPFSSHRITNFQNFTFFSPSSSSSMSSSQSVIHNLLLLLSFPFFSLLTTKSKKRLIINYKTHHHYLAVAMLKLLTRTCLVASSFC